MIPVTPVTPASAMAGAIPLPGAGEAAAGIAEKFHAYEQRVVGRTHQLFGWLLAVQWAFAVGVALLWSPRTWAGVDSAIHPHLIAAVGLGGLLVGPALLAIRWAPRHWATRHIVAFSQVSFSALLIHLTGGRIETHFHVFGSLAFLFLYRDWRVILTATLVVALDHLLRGIWFPLSVYGVPHASAWRTMEHALWVLFEDVVLIWACFVSRREMWEICAREEQNRQLLEGLEQRVRERTAALEAEVKQRELTALELRRSEERYRTLVANAPIGIFKTARSGQVLFANPYLCQLLGMPADTDLSKIDMSNGTNFARSERARLWAGLDAAGEVRGFETMYTRADGSTVEVVIHARAASRTNDETVTCEGTVEDITEQKRAKREVNALNQRLLVASRQAGMADVATGVLHNVGNVLTSVNITLQCLLDRQRASRIRILHQAVEAMQAARGQLGHFFTEDATGKQIPDLLVKLDTHLAGENRESIADAEDLVRHFSHIRDVIATQQNAARLCGVSEKVPPAHLFEEALKLTADSLEHHGVSVARDFAATPEVKADRHKVLQILVNLVKNAKDALVAARGSDRAIVVRIAPDAAGMVALSVTDNGVGIAPEHLTRIFQHGFTTKSDGHGFGLHSCVLAAREMAGDVAVASPGPGLGATFTLTLPVAS